MRNRTRPIFAKRGWRRGVGVTAAGLVAIVALNGASRRPHLKLPQPWFDGKNFCTFPLASSLPASASGDAVAAAIVAGYQRSSVVLPDHASPVVASGKLPDLSALHVDLSNARLDPEKKTEGLSDKAKPEQQIHADQLTLAAKPMLCERSQWNVDLSASHVTLDVKRDKGNNPLLTLDDAKDGKLALDISIADVDALLLAAAKANAATLGFTVQSCKLTLATDTDHDMHGKLDVQTKLAGLIGAGLHFTGRVSIDDDMTARVSGLNCTGDDVLGPIIVGLLKPALEKYNDKIKPIVSFPQTALKLRDVRLAVDDSVHIRAAFGS